jgi:hypothetical protein
MSDNALEILGWVQKILDEREFNYEAFPEKNALQMKIPLECKLQSTTIIFNFRDGSFTINAYILLTADEKHRKDVGEYLMRCTYGLRFGNFEIDYNDGEVRYRLTVDCEDRTEISDNFFMGNLSIPIRMLERYGDGMVAVMFGFKTPEEALKDAEEPTIAPIDDEATEYPAEEA